MKVEDLIGKKFADGGRGPEQFDCWGLVTYIYKRERGVVLPDYTISAFDTDRINGEIKKGKQEPMWSSVRTPLMWDLCLFSLDLMAQDFINHVGLHMGNGQFIHATLGHDVSIAKLRNPYWAMRYKGAVRWQG